MRNIAFLLCFGIMLLVFSSCVFPNERQGCEGGPKLINPFPDTLSLALRSEPYRFEMENPEMPVFEHSGGGPLIYSTSSSNFNIVRAVTTSDPEYVLFITTVDTGIAMVSVTAFDDCEGSATDIFAVEVAE